MILLKSLLQDFFKKRGAGIAKSVWTRSGYAKSAFKEHIGVYFDEQDKYIIKEIK